MGWRACWLSGTQVRPAAAGRTRSTWSATLPGGGGAGADSATWEDPRRRQPVRPGVGRVLRGTLVQGDAEHARGSGTNPVSVGEAAGPLPGVWPALDGARAMAH